MPAAAVFRDPDNNLLEFITVLPYPPRRDLGVLSGVIGFAGSHRRLTPREFPLASFDLTSGGVNWYSTYDSLGRQLYAAFTAKF